MKNVDLEIYISQLVSFFENNPNDLLELIGSLQKDEFYQKLKERCEKNIEEGIDLVLTREQIVNIVVELKIPDIKEKKHQNLDKIIQKTKFGNIILN
jgi:hypothetical protein